MGVTLLSRSPPSLEDDPGKVSSSQRSVFRQKVLQKHKLTVFQSSLDLSNFSRTNLCINTVMFPLKSCLGMHTTIPATRAAKARGVLGQDGIRAVQQSAAGKASLKEGSKAGHCVLEMGVSSTPCPRREGRSRDLSAGLETSNSLSVLKV